MDSGAYVCILCGRYPCICYAQTSESLSGTQNHLVAPRNCHGDASFIHCFSRIIKPRPHPTMTHPLTQHSIISHHKWSACPNKPPWPRCHLRNAKWRLEPKRSAPEQSPTPANDTGEQPPTVPHQCGFRCRATSAEFGDCRATAVWVVARWYLCQAGFEWATLRGGTGQNHLLCYAAFLDFEIIQLLDLDRSFLGFDAPPS